MAGSALLLLVIAALWAGPALYFLLHGHPRSRRAFDALVLAGIVALLALDVIPAIWHAGGPQSGAFLALGLLGPSLMERAFRRQRRQAHIAALALAVAGLLLHTLGDGVVLVPDAQGRANVGLALAIALHNLPVGTAVWWLLAPNFGARWPALGLAVLSAATVGGYVFGLSLADWTALKPWAWFQALVAGSILHVAFGRPHLHAH